MPQGNAWLWLSLMFWRLKILDFLYFAVSVPCFNRLRLWWNCASWIDDNMHWALIDVLLWYSFCIQDYWVVLGCSQLAYFCFQKFICNFVSRGNAWLWLSLIFWRLKNLDFLYFAVSVPSFIQLRLWWNCASWIDDNMHWALIDLFCDTLFVYKTIELSSVALNWLATSAFKNLYAILCLEEALGFDWVWFFKDLKI